MKKTGNETDIKHSEYCEIFQSQLVTFLNYVATSSNRSDTKPTESALEWGYVDYLCDR